MNRTYLLLVMMALPAAAPAAFSGGSSPGLNPGDLAGIRDAYNRHRQSVVSEHGGFRAENLSQQWTSRFDGRGFTVKPGHGAWEWGLELREYGFVGATKPVTGQAQMRAEGSRVVYSWDSGLREWFVNEARGVEHGFTLARRPQGNGKLVFRLGVRGGLRAEGEGEGVGFFGADGAAVVRYAGLRVWDADGRALAAKMKADGGGVAIEVEESGARYPLTVDPLAQQAYLKAPNTDAGDWFGRVVAISGDTVAVGAPFEAGGATTINGNQADNSKQYAGAVYVFVRSGGSWTFQAYLKASNSQFQDQLGFSVAIDGDTIVAGAIYESSGNGSPSDNSAAASGAAYVFVRNGTTWTQQAYLKASNIGAGDSFGASVAISGNTIAVGAPSEASAATGINGNQDDNSAPDSGAVYVFTRSGTTWTQQAYLKASNTGANDQFGLSVALSDDTLIVGAPSEDSAATGINGSQSDNNAANSGAAYVFTRSAGSWTQQAYLKASNTGAGDYFGGAVAISGSTAVVTARQEASSATGVNGNQFDNSASNSGAAYVFTRSGSTWTQQAYLKASNTGANDSFGFSADISGDIIVIGATGESSAATGVDGTQTDNSLQNSGAAYVFTRSSGAWAQTGYLKSSNTGLSDRFGSAVGVDGTTVVVGAYLEDGSSTTINGASNDNATDAGAAYVFTVQDVGSAVRFVPVTPCRVADTRTGAGTSGQFGPPRLAANTVRDLPIPASPCGIPSNAQAYSLNITVVPTGVFGFLTVWPTGQSRPTVSTLNSLHGGIVANAALVPAGTDGSVSVYVENEADVIVDINGYFVSGTGSPFYTVTPCRLGDTRTGSGYTGAFGSPFYSAGSTRTLPLPSASCNLPPTATAYSLNATVLPHNPLAYLTMYPAGSSAPLVSTLNSFDAAVVANAALVPAGTSGGINLFVTDQTDVVLDTNGYFGPPGGGNALEFYPVTPCRVADTRVPGEGAPVMGTNEQRTIVMTGRCGLPATAKAYSVNVTVVPREPLGFLTLWPAGSTQPVVSTVNSFLSRIVANAAIVPAGTGGSINVFVTNPTDVILDVNGYFQ